MKNSFICWLKKHSAPAIVQLLKTGQAPLQRRSYMYLSYDQLKTDVHQLHASGYMYRCTQPPLQKRE